MIRNHCYWLSGMIISIYFSLLIHSLASPPIHFCRHDQRDALLEFKDEIDEHEMDGVLLEHEVPMGVSPDVVVPIDEVVMDESGRKYTFLDFASPWNKSIDCCHWEGVTCDDKYGQVISLDLHYTVLNSSLKTNSSLFRLGYLRYLDLSSCYIQGEIPSSIGKLSRLTFIDLSFNSFVGKIPVSIGNLSRLTNLDLSANLLVGKIPSSTGNLSYLTLVDLTSNELVGKIPDVIGNLYHLRNLSLAFNHLTGEIPSSIGNLSHLLKLDLFSNNLVGEVPTSMGNLKNLRVIRLDRNNFSGNIPILLANLTKLFLFSLSYNNFTSTLPSNMSKFHNLAYFDVSENSFVGPFPKSLFSIPSLNYVDLGGNQFTGPIQLANTSSTSKLCYLFLSSNRFNGPIPESISEFLNLVDLDLSHNNFTGPIPRSLSKLINLWRLRLSNNKLKGEVPGFLWRLATVNLSHNIFSSFENSPKETQILNLDLSSNSFQGPFPHWICKLDSIFFIDLSNNLFNGSIPPCLRNSIVLLQEMILRNNSFSGVVPDIFAGATKLRSLDVSVNQLEGQFPKSLINCKTLQFVNVESNRIKDKFPFWLGFLPFLNVLILKSNEFYGPLYHRHMSVGFKSLKVMDVSHNNFTGTLPRHYFSNWGEPTTSPPEGDGYMINSLNDSSIYRNSMEMVNKGVETRFERIREDFIAIDFSGNRIYGKIPESIGFLKELRLLNLSGNAFIGDIPQSLANLKNLETLDLSSNKLSGQIPQDLGNLSFLSYMNFSHNLLQGPVPRGTQFQRQNCSSFWDNPGLYGLEDICGESHVLVPTSQQPEEFSEAEEQMFNWVAAAIAYGPGVFCGLVIGHIFSSHNHEWFTEKFGRRKLSLRNGSLNPSLAVS